MIKKHDIVYILGTGSKWFNNEIRYSIRSLEKNLKNRGRIFIVGEWPHFLDTKRVIHIPAVDPAHHKLLNAMHKIRLACIDRRVSEEFILMNDDFFFLKSTDKITHYNMGTLKEGEENHRTKTGYYYRAIKETIEYLEKAGVKDPVSYELHYPMVINKEKFLEVIEPLYYAQKPVLFRSVYGNIYPTRSAKREDTKIYDLEDFKKMGKPDLISTDNKVCLEPEFQFWLRGKFSKKALCEK